VRSLVVALLTGVLIVNPALASEKKKKASAKKEKMEAGASCKAPAVGLCAACTITCPPATTASCTSGVMAGDVCHIQPSCRCGP
jgi:hypothetical protein